MKMVKLFQSLIKKARNVLITTHIHPDADGIGSEIALCMALKQKGINAICVNEEELLSRYRYLDPDNVVIGHQKYIEDHPNFEIDLFIVTDTNSLGRIGPKMQGLVHNSKNLLFIDHHPCPKELAAIHCIDTNMAATGELVGSLIRGLGIEFTKEIALPLYTSILIDTSSFRYPSVQGDTHRLIADLMDSGVEPALAYNKIYGTKKLKYMKLLGTVISGTSANHDQSIAWIKITEKDLERFDIDPEDTHGFVNHLLILDNIKVGCMFRQIGSKVKISFRSQGQIDVGIIAQALGGGGHDHSAATLIEGPDMDQVIRDTVKKIELMLKEIPFR